MKILGYSAYWHSKQTLYLEDAYKMKSEIVEKSQSNSVYGSGLGTFLIFYNFEAVPDEFSGTDFLEKKIEVQRYNSREQSLRVNVFVGYEELTSVSYEEQIAFYYRTTMQAIEMVKNKFAKRKNAHVNVDFKKLYQDIKDGYLSSFPWLEQHVV